MELSSMKDNRKGEIILEKRITEFLGKNFQLLKKYI